MWMAGTAATTDECSGEEFPQAFRIVNYPKGFFVHRKSRQQSEPLARGTRLSYSQVSLDRAGFIAESEWFQVWIDRAGLTGQTGQLIWLAGVTAEIQCGTTRK